MNAEQKAQVAASLVGVCGDLIKGHVEHKREKDLMQTRMEKERVVAQSRGQSLLGRSVVADDEEDGDDEPTVQTDQGGGGGAEKHVDDALERAIEDENCEFCVNVYEELLYEGVETKVRGWEEMSKLKTLMAQDPDREEVEDLMDTFDVVPKVAERL